MTLANTVREEQLTLPIDLAPPFVRDHGLVEVPPYPYVSHGKIGDSHTGLFRVSPQNAWSYPEIQINPSNSLGALVFDLDGGDSQGRLIDAMMGQKVATPSWFTRRPTSGGIHVVYALERPVHRGPESRLKPIQHSARICEWYAEQLDADSGYTGLITHNPVHDQYVAQGMARDGHKLDDLAAYIETGWRMPPREKRRTHVGRNCALFADALRWAGLNKNNADMPDAIYTYCHSQNHAVADWYCRPPLESKEVNTIAKSVARYWAIWIEHGHSPKWIERQRTRARASVRARQSKNADRNAYIIRERNAGKTYKAIAADVGLSVRQVIRIAKSDISQYS